MLTLADPLEHARRVHASKVAVIDGATTLDYGQLHARCARLAAGLYGLGLARGDRVAILAANSSRYLEASFGVPAHGLTLVPLNTRLAEAELATILAESGAKVLLTDRDPGGLPGRVEHVIDLERDYEQLLERAPARAPERTRDEDALAVLFYTGGTTGRPKGVMLTHRNLVSNAFHKTIACSLRGDDVFLAAPPMFHVAGVAPIVGLVWLGARTIVVPGFDAEQCLDMIEQHGITLLIPVPTMLAGLAAAQQRKPRRVGSLRMIGHAGSPIATSGIVDAHAAFPGAELAQFYGATETSSVVTVMRDEQRVLDSPRLGSCGVPTPGVAIRITRSDGSECADGELGEIWVRGPNVTPGYFNDAAATAAAFSDGWYRSGDVGVVREGGYLFVVDRIKDMIVSGGENVYSIEVEDVLHRHPSVAEAAVFAVPDATWGEAVHAAVVPRADAGLEPVELEAELKAHCRQFIAGYKVPKRILVQLEPLPKSGPGKVLKRALRERYGQPG